MTNHKLKVKKNYQFLHKSWRKHFSILWKKQGFSPANNKNCESFFCVVKRRLHLNLFKLSIILFTFPVQINFYQSNTLLQNEYTIFFSFFHQFTKERINKIWKSKATIKSDNRKKKINYLLKIEMVFYIAYQSIDQNFPDWWFEYPLDNRKPLGRWK